MILERIFVSIEFVFANAQELMISILCIGSEIQGQFIFLYLLRDEMLIVPDAAFGKTSAIDDKHIP